MAALSTLLGALLLEGALRVAYPALPSIAGLEGTDFQLETLVSADAGDATGLCAEVETFLSHRSRWGPQQGRPPGGAPPAGPPGSPANAPPITSMPSVDGPVPGPPGPPQAGGLPGAPPAWKLPMQGATVEAKELVFGEGAATRTLWLVGDSVTYGLGVEPEETFGALLGERLARRTGATWASRNLGIPGAGYCAALRRLDTELARAKPDLVLITFFADDLEERSLLVVQGQLVAPPDRARPAPLRWLVSTSYAANLAWHRVVAVTPPHTPDGRLVTDADVAAFGATAAELRDRVIARGGTPMFLLLPAPSEASCPDDPEARERAEDNGGGGGAGRPDRSGGRARPEVRAAGSADARCRWLSQDLGRMASALDDRGLRYLDLRGAWPAGQAHLLAEEARGLAEGGVAMHPNPQGHALLAAKLWDRLVGPLVAGAPTAAGGR